MLWKHGAHTPRTRMGNGYPYNIVDEADQRDVAYQGGSIFNHVFAHESTHLLEYEGIFVGVHSYQGTYGRKV